MSADEASETGMRLVVTCQTSAGQARIAADKTVAPIDVPLMPGARFYSLWGADRVPAVPNDGAEPAFKDWFPPAGGFRFQLITLPPAGTKPDAPVSLRRALQETEERLPGLVGKMDPRHPGMHQTETIDLVYVTQGACELSLDGGETVSLQAGDCVVQNGTRHAWQNPHREPCRLLTVTLGAAREDAT